MPDPVLRQAALDGAVLAATLEADPRAHLLAASAKAAKIDRVEIPDAVHLCLRNLLGTDHLASSLLVDDPAQLLVLQVALKDWPAAGRGSIVEKKSLSQHSLRTLSFRSAYLVAPFFAVPIACLPACFAAPLSRTFSPSFSL